MFLRASRIRDLAAKTQVFPNAMLELVSFAAVFRLVTHDEPKNGCEGDYVGAHLDGLQHGVSIQFSFKFG